MEQKPVTDHTAKMIIVSFLLCGAFFLLQLGEHAIHGFVNLVGKPTTNHWMIQFPPQFKVHLNKYKFTCLFK